MASTAGARAGQGTIARASPLDGRGALDYKKKILYNTVDDRRCLEAILHLLATGGGWDDLPEGAVARTTAWCRLRRWQETGTWPRIWQAYLGTLDAAGRKLWTRAFLGGAFVPVHKGERRWAPATRRSRSPHDSSPRPRDDPPAREPAVRR